MPKINYLHYGDAIDILVNINPKLLPKTILKKDLLNYLKHSNQYSFHVKDIINSIQGRKKYIDIEELFGWVEESVNYRKKMRGNGYRGFSYDVTTSFNFSFELAPHINFKIALMANRSLYYPPKLRKDMSRIRSHISISRYPAIAFCLGEIIETKLYIYVIQSDLAYRNSSTYREHFRGWRKMMFDEVLLFCKNNSINEIFLCPSKYLLSTCHPNFSKPTVTPNTWKIIYDKTAAEYGMKEVILDQPVNVQSINYLETKTVNTMFNLKL